MYKYKIKWFTAIVLTFYSQTSYLLKSIHGPETNWFKRVRLSLNIRIESIWNLSIRVIMHDKIPFLSFVNGDRWNIFGIYGERRDNWKNSEGMNVSTWEGQFACHRCRWNNGRLLKNIRRGKELITCSKKINIGLPWTSKWGIVPQLYRR